MENVEQLLFDKYVMKLSTLLESVMQPNVFFKLEHPITVWEITGHEPTNHYYGSSRLHKPTYKELDLEVDDEIHWLVGGMFGIEVFEEQGKAFSTKSHEIRMDKPSDDFSPFEKRGGDMRDVWAANEKIFKSLIAKKWLVEISKNETTKVQNYRK